MCHKLTKFLFLSLRYKLGKMAGMPVCIYVDFKNSFDCVSNQWLVWKLENRENENSNKEGIIWFDKSGM